MKNKKTSYSTDLYKDVCASLVSKELKVVTIKGFVMLCSDDAASLGASVLLALPNSILTCAAKQN